MGAGSAAVDPDTVSIGTTTTDGQRRLVNLDEGILDTDAVNKGQMDTAIKVVDDRVDVFENRIDGEIGIIKTDITNIENKTNYLAVDSSSTFASATGPDAVALGAGTVANGGSATALGSGARATAEFAIAAGFKSSASGANAIALGTNAGASGADAIAIGGTAGTEKAVALGSGATVSAANSVAIGADSVANRDVAALGLPANVVGTVSFGTVDNERQLVNVAAGTAATDAVNKGQLDSAIAGVSGAANPFFASESVNLTTNLPAATGVDAIAMGASANAAADNSVALGAGSVADRAAVAGSVGSVSIGSLGKERQLVNVAAGTAATDAVNKGQLDGLDFAVDARLDVVEGDIFDITGDITTITGDINTLEEKTKFLDVGSPNTAAAASASGPDAVALGAGANASAANSVAIGAGSVADRAPLAGTGGTVSFGSTGKERQLVNVAAGTAATDAVNKGQLDAAIGTVAAQPFLCLQQQRGCDQT